MRKDILYIGIIMLVAGIVIPVAFSSSLIPQGATPVEKQLSLPANGLTYEQIILNQSGVALVFFNSTSPINFYFANQSAFGALQANPGNLSLAQAAAGLEGRGVYEIYDGSASGVYPYGNATASLGPAPAYEANQTSALVTLPAGNYYGILQNQVNATASVNIGYITPSLSELSSEGSSIALYGGIAIFLLIGGVIVIIVSFFVKPKQQGPDKTDEMAQKEYDQLDAQKKQGQKKRNKKKKKQPQ